MARDGWLVDKVKETWGDIVRELPDVVAGKQTPLLPRSPDLNEVVRFYARAVDQNASKWPGVTRRLQGELTRARHEQIPERLINKLAWFHIPRLAVITAHKASVWMFPPSLGVRHALDEACRQAHRRSPIFECPYLYDF